MIWWTGFRKSPKLRVMPNVFLTFFCLITFICIFLHPEPVNAAESAIINVDSKTARPGDVVDLGISVQGFSNMKLAGYIFKIHYDPSFLEIVDVKGTNEFLKPPFELQKLTPGEYSAVSAQTVGVSGNPTLFYLTVKVLGQSGQSNVTLTVDEFADDGTTDPFGNFLDIPFSVNNGTISIEQNKPPAPSVSADDVNNLIVGINATMEYKIDDGGYTNYDPAHIPDLSGLHTVLVRVASTGINLASDPVTLHFTPNTVASSVTVINQATSGFTIGLAPFVSGLTINNLNLMDGSTTIPIINLVEESSGGNYLVSANLTAGKTYTLSISQTGYDFGQAVNVVIPMEALSAADVAEGITAIAQPAKDATSMVLPTVPDGFTVSIKTSSLPSVITTEGSITPPSADTTVELVLTVVRTADGTSADTSAISVLVPAKTPTTYGDPIQLSIGKGLARPDKITPAKMVRIPIYIDSTTFATGFNAYSLDISYDPSKVSPTGIVAYTSDNKNGIAVPASLGQITAIDSTHASVHVEWSGNTPAGATYAGSKGILFKVIFTAQTGFVPTDMQTNLEVTTANFILNSNPSNNVTPTAGIIYFGMFGDVTGEGNLTSADYGQILRFTLGKTSLLNNPARLLAAEINGDGNITSADYGQILRYTLGKSSLLNTLFQY